MKTACAAMAAVLLVGCTPRIEVAAPKEPITINMNVRIEHDIRIHTDKETVQLLERSDKRIGEQIKKSAPADADAQEKTRLQDKKQEN
ncbi:YnbE family lipoprotein [Dickeya dianthicola]|uniref:YnbE family lipoprotein n=1 Tax=Dickeya dianthicola TaxID=204039 RepID=UPI0003A912AB|nr:YnbE family lipoprotein [Dickeya dianthicola]ATO33491.1 YnbE [Dickeya dianthicola RNS04.9]MBT1428437.1 YnbE family lipoprotein [Dickeya dianthicola]MBT1432507.1 YnbE family lipoprotein [Dickeya dianthicola]MBT1459955.1 YnbE family lipoprotein [Dickeya dianthicola]MBT1489153.1 YnbE family lipoprotein [Dickeya dianthicola]